MKSFLSFLPFRPLCGLTLLALTAQAQEAAPSLTLGEALQRAATRNPGLLAQGYQERAAEALIEQAGYRPNPTLNVEVENFAGTGRVQGVRTLETTAQVSQTFERGGKPGKRVALAQRDRDAVAQEMAVRRAGVLAVTASTYVSVLAAQQRLALADEQLGLARETLDAVDARVQAGDVSPAEAARARAAIALAQAEHARQQAGLAGARAALAATWGGSAGEVGSLHGTLHIPEQIPGEEDYRIKLGQHPRLALQEAIIAGRRAALELERAQSSQDITVGGGLRFFRDGSDAGLVAGVSVPLPTRNRNQGNIRAARETLAGAEQALPAIENELRSTLSTHWQELQAAHAALKNLRTDALPATEEAYAVVSRAYQEGQLPLIDVIDAQRALIVIRREILDAEISYALALTRAEGLTTPAFPATHALISSP